MTRRCSGYAPLHNTTCQHMSNSLYCSSMAIFPHLWSHPVCRAFVSMLHTLSRCSSAFSRSSSPGCRLKKHTSQYAQVQLVLNVHVSHNREPFEAETIKHNKKEDGFLKCMPLVHTYGFVDVTAMFEVYNICSLFKLRQQGSV